VAGRRFLAEISFVEIHAWGEATCVAPRDPLRRITP
jgi:hypothetical protein